MADRYWVGGAATWDSTAGTKWSTTSGGVGGASVPIATDNVFFDANSGSGTVTVSSTRPCLSIDFTGFTGNIAGSTTPILNITGPLARFVSTMTFNSANGPEIRFSGAGVTTDFYPAGLTFRTMFTNTSTVTAVMHGHLVLTSTLTVSAGTFDANGYDVTMAGFSSSTTNVRTIDFGGGTWVITGVGTATLWSMGSVSNCTIIPDASTLTFNVATAGNNIINAGLKLDLMVRINPIPTGVNARIQLSGGGGTGGYAVLIVFGPNFIQLPGSTVIDQGYFIGEPDGGIALESSTIGTNRSFTTSIGVRGRYVSVRDINKSGAGEMSFTPGLNLGNNSNILFRPKTARAQYSMGI